MTIETIKKTCIAMIKDTSPSPVLDTEVIMMDVLGCDRTFLLFKKDTEISIESEEKIISGVEKRKTGLPVAYITGHKEFFGYDFTVTKDVLIPKPDTEILVENAISFIEEKQDAHPERMLSICDMCTGSGCVSISMLKFIEENGIIPKENLPIVTMADISKKALEVAKSNAEKLLSRHALDCVRFVQSNLFENFGFSRQGHFDMIVSNPPYVPHNESLELLSDGRSEPLLALDGDVDLEGNYSHTEDGLEVIRNLIAQSNDFLVKGGVLLLETGEYNAEKTKKLMEENGFLDTKLYQDLEGQLRNVSGYSGRN